MLQVLGDERLDEVVAVVVARVAAKLKRLARPRAHFFEEIGVELGIEELVVLALVDEDWRAPRPGPDQRSGVVLRPGGLVVAQVAAERLFPPTDIVTVRISGQMRRPSDRRPGS